MDKETSIEAYERPESDEIIIVCESSILNGTNTEGIDGWTDD